MISNCGHDENGRGTGGKAGDQTGTEYCVRTWYRGNFNCILRHPNEAIRNKIAELAIQAANNDNIGYDMWERTTFYNKLKEANWIPANINTPCESDCSASTSAICIAVGHLLGDEKLQAISPTNTTYYMKNNFKKAGFEVLTDSKYLTSDKYLVPGDLILFEGDITKGTGHVCINIGSQNNSTTQILTTTKPTTTYTKVQFIKDVQAATGAKVDGVAGPETLGKTITLSTTKNSKHIVVKYVQKYLMALGYSLPTYGADGDFGQETKNAVIQFQKKNGCVADGEITAKNKTWKKLLGLS